MALIGYPRVPTENQNLSGQRDALTTAGCKTIYKEKASGRFRARAQLAHAIAAIKLGDTLVVTKIDRLAALAAAFAGDHRAANELRGEL